MTKRIDGASNLDSTWEKKKRPDNLKLQNLENNSEEAFFGSIPIFELITFWLQATCESYFLQAQNEMLPICS